MVDFCRSGCQNQQLLAAFCDRYTPELVRFLRASAATLSGRVAENEPRYRVRRYWMLSRRPGPGGRIEQRRRTVSAEGPENRFAR